MKGITIIIKFYSTFGECTIKYFIHSCAVTVVLFASIIIIVSLSSNRVAYAHTFSENENAQFLTLIHQIEAQTMLAQNNFTTNSKLAEQYAINAINL